jgi:hypothetical protein
MPQALEPLDIPRTVIPLAIPPGWLYQALRFVQAKGLFRDTEEVGDDPDGKTGPRVYVHLGQGRPQSANCDRFLHLNPMLYLDS